MHSGRKSTRCQLAYFWNSYCTDDPLTVDYNLCILTNILHMLLSHWWKLHNMHKLGLEHYFCNSTVRHNIKRHLKSRIPFLTMMWGRLLGGCSGAVVFLTVGAVSVPLRQPMR